MFVEQAVKARVLVVDRLDMAEAIADVMSERSFAATALSSTRLAVEHLAQNGVDAVLTTTGRR